MKRILSAAFLCMSSATCIAAGASLTFTAPTTYADGSPLPASDIAQYDIDCGFKAKGGTSYTPCVALSPALLGATATGGALTFTIPGVGGDACFKLRTVTIGGGVSPWTDAKCKTFPGLTPNAPGNLTVTVTAGVVP